MSMELRAVADACADAAQKVLSATEDARRCSPQAEARVPSPRSWCGVEVHSGLAQGGASPVIADDALDDECAPEGSQCFPSAEEMRMVRAIVPLAVLEAARQGECRATFRGFLIEAVRHKLGRTASWIEVSVVVTLRGTVMGQCTLYFDAMPSSSCDMEFTRAKVVGDETFVEYDGH